MLKQLALAVLLQWKNSVGNSAISVINQLKISYGCLAAIIQLGVSGNLQQLHNSGGKAEYQCTVRNM